MIHRALAALILCSVLLPPALSGPMEPVRPADGKFSLAAVGAYDQRDLAQPPGAGGERAITNSSPLAILSYGVTDRLELSARFGASFLKLESPATGGASVNAATRPTWGAGLGALLFQGGLWSLAAQAHYLEHSGHKNAARLGSTLVDYREWQAGGQLQYRYDRLLPYLGLAYSDCRVRYRFGRAGERSRRRIGVYGGAGCDFSLRCSGFLEGRFIDETGAAAGLRYTF